MSNSKIGRNDPCPCGSGKKFKNCCMNREAEPIEDFFTRSHQAVAAIKLKLDTAYRPNIKRIRRDAQQLFLRCTVNRQMTEELESFFSDWLWFDRQDEAGETLAGAYLREHQQFMSPPLQECLQALSSSYLSIYETIKNEDALLEVRDVFTQTPYQLTLKGQPDTDFNTQPMLLLGRLAEFSEGSVFSGMVLGLENPTAWISQLRRHFSYLSAVQKDAAPRQLLKDNPEVLLGLFDHALKKNPMEINDIRRLSLDDQARRQTLQEWLAQAANMDFAHTQSGLTWYHDRQAGRNKMVAVDEEQVVVCSLTVEDLEDWDSVSGGALPLLREWPVLASRFRLQPPPPALSPLWLKVMQELETERWLHTPHRELQGRTPKEEMETAGTIAGVLKLLDDFVAQRAATDGGAGLIEYMRERVESLKI